MHEYFKIDYDKHPAYSNVRINLFEYIYIYTLFLKAFLVLGIRQTFIKKYKRSMHVSNLGKKNNTVISQFNENGFMKLRDKKIVKTLKVQLQSYITEVEEKIKQTPVSVRGFSDCVIGYKENENVLMFRKIEDTLFSNTNIHEIISKYFNTNKTKLVYFQIHINQEEDEFVFKHDHDDLIEEKMNFFHVDTNSNTVKAMVYLTDVLKEENGAFQYVSGSHKYYSAALFLKRKIVKRVGAFRRDKKGKKILLGLPRSFRVKNEFDDFSSKSKLGIYIQENKVSCANGADVIIFDPLGIHRGGIVKEGKRIAVQLVFCPDQSWKTG
jgi:ectoine hydroxylase-related dioxygenase (phytanoyl-CoA dioxygenase family)